MLNHLKAWSLLIACLLIYFFGFYLFDLLEDFKHLRFNFKIADYDAVSRCLNILNFISKKSNKTFEICYLIRNNLFNQYLEINQNSKDKLYNKIGIIYSLNNDFKILYNINDEKNDNFLYDTYKKIYLSELKQVLLLGYINHNEYINNFLYSKTRADSYKIHNRVILFHDLAVTYITVSNFDINQENLNELKVILNMNDFLLLQEEKNNTRQIEEYKEKYAQQ